MSLVRGDALQLPFANDSVDLIVTSPPYFALRSYQDGGEHYSGQIGSEPTPQAFLEALWAVTAECVRVLKPSGSMFVNLGDKYAGSGGHNNGGIAKEHSIKVDRGEDSGLARAQDRVTSTRRNAPDQYNKASDGVRAKSLMGLPWRYAIGCIDRLGLILRAEIVWSKPNGLPESVTDRVRRSHEQWFHFVREPRYYAAVDEIREPSSSGMTPIGRENAAGIESPRHVAREDGDGHSWGVAYCNPLGKLPGSVWDAGDYELWDTVWSVPSEPLKVPAHLGVDHFAAFPQEFPRRLVLGWSPPAVCTGCGEGQRPQVDKQQVCGCDGTAPTRPAVVLDPFCGTGTVPMVARILGRTGIGVDLSADYLKLATWRIYESGHAAKSLERTGPTDQPVRPDLLIDDIPLPFGAA